MEEVSEEENYDTCFRIRNGENNKLYRHNFIR